VSAIHRRHTQTHNPQDKPNRHHETPTVYTFKTEWDLVKCCLSAVAHEFSWDPRTASLHVLPFTDIPLDGIT